MLKEGVHAGSLQYTADLLDRPVATPRPDSNRAQLICNPLALLHIEARIEYILS